MRRYHFPAAAAQLAWQLETGVDVCLGLQSYTLWTGMRPAQAKCQFSALAFLARPDASFCGTLYLLKSHVCKFAAYTGHC